MSTKKCSTNPKSPPPPCPEGYVQKKNKYDEECCYKLTAKQMKAMQNSTKKKENSKNKSNSSKDNSNTNTNSKDNSNTNSSSNSNTNTNSKDNSNTNSSSNSNTNSSAKSKSLTSTNTTNKSIFSKTLEQHDVNPTQWILPTNTKYINWVAETFVNYRKIEVNNEETCEMKTDGISLFPHQRFIRDYLQYKSPYRGLLLYHGLGVGKSCSSIAAAEMLMNYKKVVVMLPASLKPNYIQEILKCGNKYYDKTKHHWVFDKTLKVSYVSKKTQTENKGVWIIDESKKPNYNDLNSKDKQQIDSQISDILQTNYHFINYNGISKDKIKNEYINPNFFDNKVIIIDEVHNFISGVSNNANIAPAIYKLIMKAKNVKIILLSGTPIINKPNEIAYMINLIKGYEKLYTIEVKNTDEQLLSTILNSVPQMDSFQIQLLNNSSKITFSLLPYAFQQNGTNFVKRSEEPLYHEDIIEKMQKTFESKGMTIVKKVSETKTLSLPTEFEEFNKFFVDENTMSMINENLFMRRILGSVSHFVNNNPKLYPSTNTINESLEMSDFQYEQYVNARKEERKLEKQTKRSSLFSDSTSVYKAYSRMICNFVFPEKIIRPKPKDFKKETDKNTYQQKLSDAINSLTKTHLQSDLSIYSPKFEKMIQNIEQSPGNVLVYSQFSTAEGIEIVSKCLEHKGYSEFVIEYKNSVWDIKFDSSKPSFIRFKDESNLNEKNKIQFTKILLSIFNNDFTDLPTNIMKKLKGKTNLRGEILKVLFITQSGAEGISLKNVRQVHITEPYWNNNRIEQVIGRANRTCSHIALPKNEQNFTVYTYSMTFTEKQLKNDKNKMIIGRYDKNLTTDENIFIIAQNKKNIISGFLNCMKKTAVDCFLNNPQIGCFSFPVDFQDNKKAYTLDIYKDILDEYSKNFKKEINKKSMKIYVKTLNKHFIYVPDTNELFDFDLYKKTTIPKLVGYMEKLDDNKHTIKLL